jgi:hypothetical protein
MSNLPSRHRGTFYVAVNATFILLTTVLAISHDASLSTLAYVIVLFALCSASLLFMDGLNGRYALLAIFLAMYFVFFGMLDTVSLLAGGGQSSEILSEAELALLCGAAAAIAGYRGGVALAGESSSERPVLDWTPRATLLVGIVIWLLGTAAIIYFQVFTVPEKTNAATRHGLASLGPAWTFAVMLGQMIEPIGLVIIAYGYARYQTFAWLLLAITMVCTQIAVGFVADIKSLAMLAGILVILARLLVDGKLPKLWLLGGAAFIVFAFPLFQAYRADVTGERGLSHVQALENIDKVLDIVLANRDKVTEGPSANRSQTFFERASLKGNVELAFEHTGVDTPFRHGDTLVGLLVAFIPRLIWPDKPDVAVGQLFNKEFFHTGDAETYISPSHFGELYWNFGWTGALTGMVLIGALLGFTAAKCNLAEKRSVTRILVLLATVKYVCLGFEGSIAIAYIVWLRSLGAIGLLHLLLARPTGMADVPARAPSVQEPLLDVPLVRFPNMLR